MSLKAFFDGVAPALLGSKPVAEVALDLYALEPQRQVDANRLEIYARFCRVHRQEAIEGIFARCQTAVERIFGRETWEALIEQCFARHPMRDVEMNANAVVWPEFLAGVSEVRLPRWLAPLADFEWWVWQTRIAPDAQEPAGETLRLNPTVEVRPYAFDFVSWAEEGGVGEPREQQSLVIFWRDAELDVRRENATPLELFVLKSVVEGTNPSKADLRRQGITPGNLEATIADLREAGILEGGARPSAGRG